MNGYEKMIRLRRMKITKIISAFTALSMTITGLAVAASADSASPDFISEALGDLTNYGIVASDMVNLQMGMALGQQMVGQMNQSMNPGMQNMAGANGAAGAGPKFCPDCGTPTGGTKFCGNCGKQLF